MWMDFKTIYRAADNWATRECEVSCKYRTEAAATVTPCDVLNTPNYKHTLPLDLPGCTYPGWWRHRKTTTPPRGRKIPVREKNPLPMKWWKSTIATFKCHNIGRVSFALKKAESSLAKNNNNAQQWQCIFHSRLYFLYVEQKNWHPDERSEMANKR